MYYVTCDGYPLLDWRDDDLILTSPRVKLEANTVGEGSFTIYKTHPHYDKLKKLKSVFEVSDENGVIFRGRATGDTIDFDHGMAVDLEGAMAFFNDSVVRPFHFPDDFKENADYIAAAESGNVIEFFLGWLIDNHNSQVEDFQKMKLGNVTVSDPNNYITRSNSGYASTWEVLKAKLFDSSLEGYLCIRYEADGNYIDYISEFTETNSQEIAFGENILDLKNFTEASGTYSAIIPLGAASITLEGLEDGDITEDLVKSGDTIYSKSAVAEHGWIYAPTSETTWEDVTDDANLLTKGAEWLANGGALFSHGVEVTAVDLHFTDAQIESLRICKNVNVYSGPHGLSEQFPLTKLEVELLNPQNTKITVGKTIVPFTEKVGIQKEEAENKYSKISKTQDEIRLEVVNKMNEMQSTFVQTTEQFLLTVEDLKNQVSGSLKLDANGFVVNTAGESVTISGGQIDASGLNVAAANITGKLTASQIDASDLKVDAANITGTLTIGSLPDDVALSDDIPTSIGDLDDDVGLVTSSNVTTITNNAIKTASLSASQITTGDLNANNIGLNGFFTLKSGSTVYGYIGVNTTKGGAVLSDSGKNNFFVATSSAAKMSYQDKNSVYASNGHIGLQFDGKYIKFPGTSFYSENAATLGTSSYKWGQGYSSASTFSTSDRNEKNSIEDLPVKYLDLFDRLRPVRFKFNDGTSGRYHVGFIAQDVEDSMSAAEIDSQEFGGFGKDIHEETGADIYMLRYEEFVGILAAKLQDVDKRLKIMEGTS